MHFILDVTITSFLGIWLFLTVLHQFEALPRVIKYFLDAWAVIPTWRFFAPNPSRWDYYLFYRDKMKNGDNTKFRQLELLQERKLSHVIWNPQKRCNKTLHDCIRALDRSYHAKVNSISEPNPKSIEVLEHSLPYIILLNRALELNTNSSNIIGRQILVVRKTSLEDEPELLPILLSDFYEIP